MNCRIKVHVLLLFILNIAAVIGFEIIDSKELAYNNPVVLGCLDPERTTIKFRFFKFTENLSNIEEFINFFDNRPISIFFLGFTDRLGKSENSNNSQVADAWSTETDTNVCYCENSVSKKIWKALYFYYYTVEKRLPFVAKIVAELLVQLKMRGKFKFFSEITFAAFCLGNNLGVMTAKLVEDHKLNPNRKKIGRFFGMDPTGIGFRLSTKWRVKKGVADYTQVVHCSSTIGLGTQRRLSDADFLMNNGWVQPDCTIFDIFCNHLVCLDVFENTIFGEEFVGVNEYGECLFGPYNKDRCTGTYTILHSSEY